MLASLLSACATREVHRWRDAEYGFEVRSEFDPLAAAIVLEPAVARSIPVLMEFFGETDLSSLRVHILDRPHAGPDGQWMGLHDRGSIYLFAGSQEAAHPGVLLQDAQVWVHELVHAFVRLHGWTLPRWMEEGLANVLAAAVPDQEGEPVLYRAVDAERGARVLRASGGGLKAAELLLYQRSYPDSERLPAFYAQTTSFLRFLLERFEGDPRARFEQVRQLDRRALLAHARAWEQELDDEPVAVWMLGVAGHPLPAFRRRLAGDLSYLPRDEAWWALMARFLADGERDVRQGARVTLYVAVHAGVSRAQLEDLLAAGDPRVRRAASLALACAGDLDQALLFLDRLADPGQDALWSMEPLWISLALPPEDRLPELAVDTLVDAKQCAAWAAAWAAWLHEHAAQLRWDPRRRRYVPLSTRRPGTPPAR